MARSKEKIFHYLFAITLLVGSIAYYAMASDLAWDVISQVNETQNGTRQIFFAKYVYWVVSFPVVTIALGLVSGVSCKYIDMSSCYSWLLAKAIVVSHQRQQSISKSYCLRRWTMGSSSDNPQGRASSTTSPSPGSGFCHTCSPPTRHRRINGASMRSALRHTSSWRTAPCSRAGNLCPRVTLGQLTVIICFCPLGPTFSGSIVSEA